jgi:hydroxymethylglutaryl-CoA reductase
MSKSSRIPGFYKLDVGARRAALADGGHAAPGELATFDDGGLDGQTADGMIENVIGTYSLPLGVALNFVINDRETLVPMAIEEPSVVAAASYAAKMVRAGGGFVASTTAPVMIGQVELRDVPDPEAGAARLREREAEILAQASEITPALCARGGGPVGVEARVVAPDVLVVHLLLDCCDAMGANLVNSVSEGLADSIAEIAGGRVGLRILSNLSTHRMVTVTARVPDAALGGAEVRTAVAEASRFAEIDPYRATTHNKGIMNGVDAVLLATGQDWRSVEAGAHAYAAETGTYRPLGTWREDPEGAALIGELTMPLAVGTVGGALHVHRGARVALDMIGAETASELAQVAAAAGLASNLAALRALATDGIQRGHMSLHARVVARAAGATGVLIDRVAAEIAALGDVKTERAAEILERFRRETIDDNEGATQP